MSFWNWKRKVTFKKLSILKPFFQEGFVYKIIKLQSSRTLLQIQATKKGWGNIKQR